MDTILPSTGTYKISANINGMPLDELSFIDSKGIIQPYFEDPVSSDPDVTALVVFLRNSKGSIVGWKAIYKLEQTKKEKKDNYEDVSSDDTDEDAEEIEEEITEETAEDAEEDLKENPDEDKLLSDNDGDDDDDLEEAAGEVVIEDNKAQDYYRDGYEIIIPVKSLDGELPVFPMPKDLPMGRYTLVSQIMSGENILQRTEKSIYYMGKTAFSYDGINVHLPGIAESSQIIPKGTVIMLETALDFDSRLDPYIVWYNGKRKIIEGNFSDGAGYLLWKAPEQSGFFSLRAEVFPVDNFDGLSGYRKEISLLVSSKTIDLNLVSENVPELVHWYTFEGGLLNSKMITSAEQALKPYAKNSPKWAGVDGTYGLVTGYKNAFSLPKVLASNNETESWRILFRFKPVNEGEIFCVQFGVSREISLKLKTEDNNLVLELITFMDAVSRVYALPEQDSFITTEINFAILPEMLYANLNIIGDYAYKDEIDEELVGIEAVIDGEFQILLGTKPESGGESETVKKPKSEITAIWDELALYIMPPMEIIIVEEESPVEEEQAPQPEDDETLAD